MYLLIVFFPFLSFFCLFFFGFFLGVGSLSFALICMLCSLFVTFFCYYEIMYCGSITTIQIGKWVNIESINFDLKWNFLFDSLTINMCFIITFISTLVHFYSLSYMKDDPYLIKFFSYLSFFTFCMLILVTAGNYIQMFLGWEGVGLASYLLISFWNTRVAALQAALKAMLMNRIGDICLLISFFYIYLVFGTFNYDIIFCLSNCNYMTSDTFFLFFISLFLFFGAMGKSAQLGLHTWLPDAMEGPTPVSALIHAATMVTAGVFLVIRSSFLLYHVYEVQNFIIIIGCLTAFFAASVALFQNDIKKIIAYSTCSQLGYMFFSCGLLNFEVGLFHLINHAFFKALLFLSSGVIIHALLDEQDMRKSGGLCRILPVTYVMVCIGSLALVGFPFLSGFYSKDIILELSIGGFNFYSTFAYGFGILGAAFTAFYSFRLINLTFIVTPNVKVKIFSAHEGCTITLFVLILLGLFSLFFGFCFRELFLGFGTDAWCDSFLIINSNLFEIEWLNSFLKSFPFFFTCFGVLMSYLCIDFYLYVPKFYRYYILYTINFVYFIFLFCKFFAHKWYFDLIYVKFSFFVFDIGLILLRVLDRGLLEYIGPLAVIFVFRAYLLRLLSLLHSGYIYHYSYLFIFSFIYSFILLKFYLFLL